MRNGLLRATSSAKGSSVGTRTPSRRTETGRRVPPDQAHRRPLVPRGTAQQTLCPGRRAVPGVLGDRPAVPRRQVADQRVQVPPRLQPRLRPREAAPQQPHQGRPLPHRPACAYAGSSSRPVFICPHKQHDSGPAGGWSRTRGNPGGRGKSPVTGAYPERTSTTNNGYEATPATRQHGPDDQRKPRGRRRRPARYTRLLDLPVLADCLLSVPSLRCHVYGVLKLSPQQLVKSA
jgi:hypothetical protein